MIGVVVACPMSAMVAVLGPLQAKTHGTNKHAC